MKVYIYAIKNLLNNKCYIGSTKSPKTRKYDHFRLLKLQKHHSLHLQQSYNRYGKQFFSFYIIEECSEINRKEKELFYINHFKSYDRDFGYNIYEPNENKFKCSESTKQKILNKHILSGYAKSIDVYSIQGEKIKTYLSIDSCSKELKINRSVIYDLLNKKRKSYKNMCIFKKDEIFEYIPSKKQRNMSKFHK